MFHRAEHVLKGGLGVQGATVTVYLTGTTTKAALYATNDTSQPIANPVTTDANGRYAYYIANGNYDETVVYGAITATETYIQMNDLGVLPTLGTAAVKNLAVGTVAPSSPAINDLWVD